MIDFGLATLMAKAVVTTASACSPYVTLAGFATIIGFERRHGLGQIVPHRLSTGLIQFLIHAAFERTGQLAIGRKLGQATAATAGWVSGRGWTSFGLVPGAVFGLSTPVVDWNLRS